ncbi:CHAT domain-containing protein [Hyaloscypha finlandica]|nr:CHAT domain-containing protein [Hyaloscypha finlandica]
MASPLSNDLDRAIEVADMAVDATPLDHPDRARRWNNLGNLLGSRFEQTGSMKDLNRAIDVINIAIDATPQDHPDRAGRLSNLGNLLGSRFEQTGSMKDLNRAVDVTDIVVDTIPQDSPNRAAYLGNLGNRLGTRFEQTGSIDDLNRAIDVTNMAVDATPQDHPIYASCLSNLGTMLGRRFERTGSVDDLNRAIEYIEMAVDATPQDHPIRAACLSKLGNWLGKRFDRTGSIDDLNRAIEYIEMAVDATPQDHPIRAACLSNLGNWLGRRFEQTGSMDDLNRAVQYTGKAVDAIPQDYLNRATYLSNFGNQLSTRFDWTGSIDDLNRAIEYIEIAVEATPQDYPIRATYLSKLGNWLGKRFDRTSSMDDLNRASSIDDLNRAIEYIEIAVDATPQDYPIRAACLSNLGNWLDDLNRAIKYIDMAVDTIPQDYPNRATYLSNLGNRLVTRFDQTGSMDDLNRALSLYKEGWRCYTAPPSIRIDLARQAANILTSLLNWEESSLLLQEADTDKQHMLADFAGLASMAAATALNAGKDAYHALQLLELGRGVIAGLLMEMRGDISDLKQQHPGLADEFISLRDELDAPVDRTTSPISTDNTPSWEPQARRRREADQKFSELITRIRAQSGFDNFLLPPAAVELMTAADPDPIIVINLSSYRCDAFLIERDRIRVLELPGMKLKEVQKQARDLRSSRRAASFHATSMLDLEELGFKNPISDNSWPRLPLHAAGRHALGSTETVLDRVMSSYASSVKALIYGRRHHVREPAGPMSDHALLVAMHKTPGLSTNGILPFAAAEVEMLNDLCPSLQLRPVTPTLRKDDVLQHLQACTIFHFAGHGKSDQVDPSQSCLLLEDWETNPLTVGDLRDHRLQDNPPFLGYLSACSTGANEADRLADEGIHLVSAFQLAGFRHVVGTLWEVSDKHCVDVARVLYETMRDEGMTDVAVCRGLHRAIRALRDGRIEKEGGARKGFYANPGAPEKGLVNNYWIPYVHFGV